MNAPNTTPLPGPSSKGQFVGNSDHVGALAGRLGKC